MTTFLITVVVVLVAMAIIVSKWIDKSMKEAREVQTDLYCMDTANKVIHKLGCKRINNIPHRNRKYIEDYDGMLANVLNCRLCGGVL